MFLLRIGTNHTPHTGISELEKFSASLKDVILGFDSGEKQPDSVNVQPSLRRAAILKSTACALCATYNLVSFTFCAVNKIEESLESALGRGLSLMPQLQSVALNVSGGEAVCMIQSLCFTDTHSSAEVFIINRFFKKAKEEVHLLLKIGLQKQRISLSEVMKNHPVYRKVMRVLA